MSIQRKYVLSFISFAFLLLIAFTTHQLSHIYYYGHLAPLGLHADTIVINRSDLIGIEGIATVYHAKLTNYGISPTMMTVCDYMGAGMHETMINYIVERREPQSDRWRLVPEWDGYGSRLFCRPSFEVAETHLVRRRLWPGQSIRMGEVIPAERPGFHVGDDGRFTIFLGADGNWKVALSTAPFRVEQQMKIQAMPSRAPQ